MVTITIRTDNSAFEYSHDAEVARILRRIARDFEERGWGRDEVPTRILDINGNTVGEITEDDGGPK